MNTALLDRPVRHKAEDGRLEADIVALVEEESVLSLDGLVARLPAYSWSQIFNAVDRLARLRRIVLRRHRSQYTLFSTDYAA